MTTDEKLERLIAKVESTGQALLGHDTVRILPLNEIEKRRELSAQSTEKHND